MVTPPSRRGPNVDASKRSGEARSAPGRSLRTGAARSMRAKELEMNETDDSIITTDLEQVNEKQAETVGVKVFEYLKQEEMKKT